MRTVIGLSSLRLGLACLCIAIGLSWAAEDNPAPPRVKPISERTLDFKAALRAILGIVPADEDQVAMLFKCALSADGKTLACLDMSGKVTLWDATTGANRGRFGTARARCFALSPDGKRLVVAAQSSRYSESGGDAVELWDIEKGSLLKRLDAGANRMIFTALAFSPDGRTLALGAAQGRESYDGRIRDKDKKGGEPETPPPGSDRKQRDFAIHLWDASTGEEMRQIDGPKPRQPGREDDFPYFPNRQQSHYDCLLFSPDGRSLAMVCQDNLHLWELATGKERCVLQVLHLPPRKPNEVFYGEAVVNYCLACSPDGRRLALGSPDALVRQWDLGSGRELPPLVGHQGPVRAVGYAPDGKSLWSLGWDTRLYTWPTTGAEANWKPAPARLTDADLEGLWKNLGSPDALTHYAALQVLAASPQTVVPFLRKQLKPAQAAAAGRVQKLVETITRHQDYNERRKAAIELRELGEAALPSLQRGRGDMLLTNLVELIEADLYASPEHRQRLGAVQILETVGSEEARKLLSELAGGAGEMQLSRHAKAAHDRLAAGATVGRDRVLDTLWADLAGEDSRKALFASRALVAVPEQSVPFLREQLGNLARKEAFEDDPKRIARLIDQLDSDDFATRDDASKELGKLGPLAAPALRQALAKAGSPEMKRRIQELIAAADHAQPLTEKLRVARALEILEQVGTPEARKVCEAVRQDAKNAWLRAAAADSILRLGK
jgi:WD40 repeat protein